MSFNISGTFKAIGYSGTDVSNFVGGCYAEDTNMSLTQSYLHTEPASERFLRYDLVDFNTTNPAVITRPREQGVFGTTAAPLVIGQNDEHFVQDMKGAISMDLGYNFARTNNTPLDPRFIGFDDFNITYATSPNINVNMIDNHQVHGDINIDSNISFVYARAKPGKEFYEDVTASSIATPVSAVVYCSLGYAECQNRRVLTLLGQTNESDWWLSWNHQTARGDGDIVLSAGTPTEGSGAPSVAPTVTNIISEARDGTITVSSGADPVLPLTVPVNLVTDPALANFTDRWMIYNPNNAVLAPSPFYRVRFIGNSTWTGIGQTGNVVGTPINAQKTKRLDW
jgi:hypothetical protein